MFKFLSFLFRQRKENSAGVTEYSYAYHKARLDKRIGTALAEGNVPKAIGRLEGFLELYPYKQEVHDKIGELYLAINGLVRAGRHLYFKENKTDEEMDAVCTFERSLGNDAQQLSNALVYKNNFKLSALDEYTKNRLHLLFDQLDEKYGVVPSRLLHVKRFIERHYK